jgi:hypothetical protein
MNMMKPKCAPECGRLLIIIGHLLLMIFMLMYRNFSLKVILEWYLLALLPSFLLANISYLVKKKTTYSNHIKKELLKNLITLIVFFGVVIYLTNPNYISRNQASADLDYFIEKLTNIHPDLYHNISQDAYTAILNDYKNSLPEKISAFEFYRGCSRLSAYFHDGHTHPTPAFPLWTQLPFRPAFPYQIRIINDRIYVVTNFDILGRIPVGSEIVAINGKTPRQFISEAARLVSYENIAWRNKLISDPINIAIWNDFHPYTIKYRRYPDKRIRQTQSSGGPVSLIFSAIRAKMKRPAELTFKILPRNIGYLGFYGCNDLKGYQKFYESTFQKIKEKKIEKLIIDLRNNGGGHSIIGAELMQYLFHQPFKEFDSIAFKVSREIAATGKIDFYLRQEDQIIGTMYSRVIDGYYQPRYNPLRFSGKSYLLINNGTFSSGTIFASAYQSFGGGTIIGEETGGLTVCFGDAHFFNLPNSKIKMMVSWKEFTNIGGVNNRSGVMPDYVISNTIEDDIHNRDRALAFTIDLIEKNKTAH